MDQIDVEDLNPGIRKTVLWLNSIGFETCDSGDGETHDYECDRDQAYVVMQVDPSKLISESHRLEIALADRGVAIEAMSIEHAPCIQATYDPANEIALIELMCVSDRVLFGDEKVSSEVKS